MRESHLFWHKILKLCPHVAEPSLSFLIACKLSQDAKTNSICVTKVRNPGTAEVSNHASKQKTCPSTVSVEDNLAFKYPISVEALTCEIRFPDPRPMNNLTLISLHRNVLLGGSFMIT